VIERAYERVLDRLLGKIEVPRCANESGHDPAGLLAKDAIDSIERRWPRPPDAVNG
jgi:hypothetical protein